MVLELAGTFLAFIAWSMDVSGVNSLAMDGEGRFLRYYSRVDEGICLPLQRLEQLQESSLMTNPIFARIHNRSKVVREAMRSINNGSQYTADIMIGTPSQSFKVILDTGSTATWVPSISCTSLACAVHKRYDASLSASAATDNSDPHKEPKHDSVVYGTGSASLTRHYDDISIGPMVVKSQLVEAADRLSLMPFAFTKFDGIMGLGFNDRDGVPKSILESIRNQNLLDNNMFSFYFAPSFVKSNDEGTVVFGGLPMDHLHDSVWPVFFPLTELDYWSVKLHSIAVGETEVLSCYHDDQDTETRGSRRSQQEFGSGIRFLAQRSSWEAKITLPAGCVAVADTGSSLMTLPPEVFMAVQDSFPEDRVRCSSRDTQPSLYYRLVDSEGQLIELELSPDYLFVEDDDDSCILGIMPMEVPPPLGPVSVMGLPMLQKYITGFDRDHLHLMMMPARHG